jgi:hypothetical protein
MKHFFVLFLLIGTFLMTESVYAGSSSPQNTFLFTAKATQKTKEKPITQEKGLKLLSSFVKKGHIFQLFKQKENPN